MLAFVMSVMMMGSFDPSILTVPIVHAEEIDRKAEWIEALHQCENPKDVEKVLDTNDRHSYGYVMFQMNTWLSFGKKFGATKENIGDDELQKKVARDMLDKGLWKHWYHCSKRVSSSLGSFPADDGSL